MSPVSVMWFWRGLKGHSVTFAVLFASLVLGFSAMAAVHRFLAWAGVHWLFILLVPFVLVRWLSRKEAVWIPDEKKRRRLARALLFGSVVIALLISFLSRPA